MTTALQVLRAKSADVFSVSPQATVYEALELMAEHDVGAVLVLEEGRLQGVLSERDYARKVVLLDRGSKQTQVWEIMSKVPVCIGPHNTVEDCMALMTDKRVRHLPVVDEGMLLGVLSIGDLVKETIGEMRFTIEQLELYIHA
jgi:CBS domain-containing protein